MSRPERVAPLRGCTDNNACAQMKDMLGSKIPPTPLYKRGALNGFLSGKRLSSPFSKGGPRPARHRSRSGEAGGGILLRGRLSQGHRSILSVKAKLNYTTCTAGGFRKY
jgi:hypothetical protein